MRTMRPMRSLDLVLQGRQQRLEGSNEQNIEQVQVETSSYCAVLGFQTISPLLTLPE